MLSRQQCSATNPCSEFGSTDNGCLTNLKNGQVGSNKYSLIPEAAEALDKMYEAMPQDVKNDLVISDSYRPLKIQCNIFNFNVFEKTGKRIKVGTANTPVARPGTSNHGWGRALDLSKKKAQDWIRENGSKYGWCWGEVKSEPWHFTFCGPGPNRYSMCDSMCKEKMDISVTSSSSTSNTDTSTDTTDKKNLSNFELIGGGKLTGFLDTFFPSDKKDEDKKEDEKEKENEKETKTVNEHIDRIHEIMKKIL